MPACGGVLGLRNPVDAWLEDPDVVRAEFEALIAANFSADPPGTVPGPIESSDPAGPERSARRRNPAPAPVGAAPPARRVPRERGPPPAESPNHST